ncbi:phosphatase PAP2 family protein [Neisseriaceae bacterium JH1-16]|nr:phosphatase PAP2 family protein [Neisseriaceae bacterium JH1-16]
MLRYAGALFLILGLALPSLAETLPYVTAKDVDLTRLLAPPPANDSPQTQAELQEVLRVQARRTTEMAAAASADQQEDVFRFANVFGAKFKPENLPVATAFFARVAESEGAVVDPAKDRWQRPRPFLLSSDIKPSVKMSKSGAYPSGHTSLGYLMAVVLGNMVPEKRSEVFARAADYANNRIVGGVHYPSDIQAGRITGTVIAAEMMTRPDFQRDYAAARAEVRQLLGYPL